MGAYLGDFAEDATVYIWFNTVGTTGAPITLAGTLTDDVKVYKNGSADEHTTYYTPTVDFDSRTGLHYVAIDMSAHAFYATASDYIAVLVDGTADSVSVAGTVIGRWSCENRSSAKTATAVVKKLGMTVTASGVPTTTSLPVNDAAASLTETQIGDALILNLTTGQSSRISAVSGTAPNLTLTLSPALTAAPSAGNEFVIFAKYVDAI